VIVLVKMPDAEVSRDTAMNYTAVLLIWTYREVYADDLEGRLGLKKSRLPSALAVSTLLNPILARSLISQGVMKMLEGS
jgi:hypothetical protein